MFGLDESDLGDDASVVAKSLDVIPVPDPEPNRDIFIRSDQYSFIRRGIPSVMIAIGYASDLPEEKIVRRWLTERYHAPSDDLNQPLDRKAAGEFDVLAARLLRCVANRDHRPHWKDLVLLQSRFGE